MTKRKGSRRREKKMEDGRNRIRNKKYQKVEDKWDLWLWTSKEQINYFLWKLHLIFFFSLQFTTMILQTSPLFYEWKKKEGTFQNLKAEVSIWHRKIMVVATKWTSFFVLGLVFLTENADNDRNQDQRNSKWQKIKSWKRDTNDKEIWKELDQEQKVSKEWRQDLWLWTSKNKQTKMMVVTTTWKSFFGQW